MYQDDPTIKQLIDQNKLSNNNSVVLFSNSNILLFRLIFNKVLESN